MKIRLPFGKNLYIENSFSYSNVIVSLGCDCHPAYLLDTLHLRKQSLPFDWLRTKPTEGLHFAAVNFKDNFEYFLTDLTKNEQGRVVSRSFPCSEFFHDSELIGSKSDQEKYIRKITRLQNLRNEEKIDYLYVMSISDIHNLEISERFLKSINDFLAQIKKSDVLHIYFRHDSITTNNPSIFNYFLEKTESMSNVVICEYLRDMKMYGIWGNEKEYRKLLSSLQISIKKKLLPELYISSY